MYLSEIEFQHKSYSQAHARLMGGIRRAPVIKRDARMKMKALLDAQIQKIDIVPRGKIKFWLKTIREADEVTKAVFAEMDKDWRSEVAQIITARKETLARVKGENRDANIVETRREISNALYKRGWSLNRIGRLMNRDHTSVLSLLHPEKHRARYAKARALHVENALANTEQKVE